MSGRTRNITIAMLSIVSLGLISTALFLGLTGDGSFPDVPVQECSPRDPNCQIGTGNDNQTDGDNNDGNNNNSCVPNKSFGDGCSLSCGNNACDGAGPLACQRCGGNSVKGGQYVCATGGSSGLLDACGGIRPELNGSSTGSQNNSNVGSNNSSTSGSSGNNSNQCESDSDCGANEVCQGVEGRRTCQVRNDGQCNSDGAVCGGPSGYIGFQCDTLTNNQCLQNSSTFSSFGEASSYANANGCGQVDTVWVGGPCNRQLCGGFTIYSSGCGTGSGPTNNSTSGNNNNSTSTDTRPPRNPSQCGGACTGNSDCTNGHQCVGGQCRLDECVADPSSCNAIGCEPLVTAQCGDSCTSDAQCSEGHSCNGGTCALDSCIADPTQCTSDGCQAIDPQCGNSCDPNDSNSCPQDHTCSPDTNTCILDGCTDGSCTDDLCAPICGGPCNPNNSNSCPVGHSCDAGTNTCILNACDENPEVCNSNKCVLLPATAFGDEPYHYITLGSLLLLTGLLLHYFGIRNSLTAPLLDRILISQSNQRKQYQDKF